MSNDYIMEISWLQKNNKIIKKEKKKKEKRNKMPNNYNGNIMIMKTQHTIFVYAFFCLG